MAKNSFKPSVRPAAFDLKASDAAYRKISEWLSGLEENAYDTSDSAVAWENAVEKFITAPDEAKKAMREILDRGYLKIAEEVLIIMIKDQEKAKKVLHEMLQDYYGLLAKAKLGELVEIVSIQLTLAKVSGMSPKALASYQQWLDAARAEMKTTKLSLKLEVWLDELDKLAMILKRASEQLSEYNAKMDRERMVADLKASKSTPITSEPDPNNPFAVLADMVVPEHVEAEPEPAPVVAEEPEVEVDEVPFSAKPVSRKRAAAGKNKPAGKTRTKRTRHQTELEELEGD